MSAEISYIALPRTNGRARIGVYLNDGRRDCKVGEIRTAPDGYRYHPTSGVPGEVYPTIQEVKATLARGETA